MSDLCFRYTSIRLYFLYFSFEFESSIFVKTLGGLHCSNGFLIRYLCISDEKDVISAVNAVKPANLYFYENPTPQRQTVVYALRKARTEFPTVVGGSCTQKGANYVWLKPANTRAPGARNTKHEVSSYSALSAFRSKTLKKQVLHFVSESKH